MNELLTFIIKNASFLYDEYAARFVNSQTNGSSAFIDLQVDGLRLRFSLDRGTLTLGICSAPETTDYWYSLDVVKQMLTGKVVTTTELCAEDMNFLRSNFGHVIEAFSLNNIAMSKSKLLAIEKERARKWFGDILPDSML